MKKLLLVFMLAIGFVTQVSAGIDYVAKIHDLLNDLFMIYETATQMRIDREQQEAMRKQQLEKTKRRVFAFESGNTSNLFENKRDVSTYAAKTYKINRE